MVGALLKNNATTYRYGFQGQEKDNEVYDSDGSSVNYSFRMYNSRVARFLSVDPIAKEFPHNAPYNFSENRVLDGIELEGLEVIHYTSNLPGLTGQGSVDLGLPENAELKAQMEYQFGLTLSADDVLDVDLVAPEKFKLTEESLMNEYSASEAGNVPNSVVL
ncbi:MAG: hypothetical protein MK078_18070 [Crocinitomicaceae bacterium]|nr:hypothetical protein [Crocinitomicaceae bacterium]